MGSGRRKTVYGISTFLKRRKSETLTIFAERFATPAPGGASQSCKRKDTAGTWSLEIRMC